MGEIQYKPNQMYCGNHLEILRAFPPEVVEFLKEGRG